MSSVAELGSFFITTIGASYAIVQYKNHLKEEKRKLLCEYNQRYSSDKNIESVIVWMLQVAKTDKITGEIIGVNREREAKSISPGIHKKEMFMRFFEELNIRLEKNDMNANEVYSLFAYYALKFDKYWDFRLDIKDYKNELELRGMHESDRKVFHDYWTGFRSFISKMKTEEQKENNKIIKTQNINVIHMKNYRYLLGFALLVAGALPAFSQVSNNNEDGVYKVDQRLAKDFVPGQVLVKFKDASPVNVRRAGGRYQSVDKSNIDAVLQKFGVETMEKVLPNENPKRTLRRSKAFNGETIQEKDLSQLYQVKLSEKHAYEVMPMVNELKELDEVEFAEPNYKVYLTDAGIAGNFGGNPYVTQQWYLDNYGVKQLWNKPIINPKRPVIAIIDTGVDMTHPDLKDNLWTNTAEAEGEEGYDNDGNGFAGDVHGWDFINNTPNVRDFNMHGTHVAGIAAAANNGIGIIGANPMALIMPISVMQSDGTGDVATIIKGIDYAVKMGADVLNLSLGTYANSLAMRQALEKAYQTAVIVAAAGNDFMRIDVNPKCHPICKYGVMFPAGYSFVLGVQATTQDGDLAGFSNHDMTGPNFSSISTRKDPDGFNYELKAPGTNMLSTIPGGKYKVLQGTSMAAPLVAGAISALKMVKKYDTQEILWGDLLHTDNIAQAYAITKRPAELDLMKIMYRERKELADETEEDYGGDGEIDAGETISLYPVIRTTFGAASNIQMKLEMGDEFEDPNTVEILTPGWVNFGLPLSAYGKGVSLNPMKLKVSSNVADNRHIKMKFIAKCDETSTLYEGHFTMVVNNMVKINGLITEDRTLTADHVYLVNDNIGIMEGTTLTIEPGTRLEFAEGAGLSSYGKLVAKGSPEKPIVFTGHNGAIWRGINPYDSSNDNQTDFLSYCLLEDIGGFKFYHPYMEDCIIKSPKAVMIFNNLNGKRINIVDIDTRTYGNQISTNLFYSNIVNNNFDNYYENEKGYATDFLPLYSQLNKNNYFNNFAFCDVGGDYYHKYYSLRNNSEYPNIDTSDNPSYLGTACESVIRPYIYEMGNAPNTFGTIDLSNMRITPVAEAHGIVWKVVVNGKDAQDEYEDLAPLGVGKHKFEVYFNRPMNKKVAPQISFGVREPYTQQAVDEDGSWNEEGTIYTAYKTISGKTKSDGINRIYVWGAEDDEFFEIPYEKTRFNVMINAAGSMATGFMGEAGLGRVNLMWNNENNDFDDAMGFNIYRYTVNDEGKADTICINKEIVDIETTEYTDYDVTPGTTYYYLYKVLSTDLKEYDVSNVVAVTPQTSTEGDANGSGDVDVADVITTVNYAAGMDPKPFIFEAADINKDEMIDILDVVGIIQKILNPAAARVMAESTATYSIEDGVVYVDSPVDLAGVQVQLTLNGRSKKEDVRVSEDLNGFEQTSAWLTDNDYLFLAYNMNGKTLSAGKHALLTIGDAEIASIRLSDATGHNVIVEQGNTTSIEQSIINATTNMGIYNIHGQRIAANAEQLPLLKKGVYIVDGKKVIKWK